MTVFDLWTEYRQQCCPPELDEPGASLYWQRMAFFAGVTATIGSLVEDPSCFDQIRDSVALWMASRRWHDDGSETEPVFTLSRAFESAPVASCFGVAGLIDALNWLDPNLYTIRDRSNRAVGTATSLGAGRFSIELENAV